MSDNNFADFISVRIAVTEADIKKLENMIIALKVGVELAKRNMDPVSLASNNLDLYRTENKLKRARKVLKQSQSWR